MALGGWIYHNMLIASFDHTNDTLFESTVIDPMITLISGISGWSVSQAKSKYMADSGWHFRFSHSGGAELAVVWVGETTTSTTYIHADNMVHGALQSGSSGRRRCYFSYWPAGHSGVGAASPNLTGYVPVDGLGFMWGSRGLSVTSGHSLRLHFMARGDDLIIVSEYDTSYVDSVSLLGSCLIPFHAADSGSRSTEGEVNRWATAYSATSRHLACFASDNSTRIWYDPGFIINYDWLTSSINNAAPWSYVPGIVGRPLGYGATGLASGITSLSGIKGQVNQEWFRWTVPSGGPAVKQQLASGNLIHVAEGVVLGWDPSNGAMS